MRTFKPFALLFSLSFLYVMLLPERSLTIIRFCRQGLSLAYEAESGGLGGTCFPQQGAWVGRAPHVKERWLSKEEIIEDKLASQGGRTLSPLGFLSRLTQGDLPLFFYGTFGAIAGFVMGYFFRGLFGHCKGNSRVAPTKGGQN